MVDTLKEAHAEVVNEQMHAVLDKYTPRRRPLRVADYDWERVDPDLMSPNFKSTIRFVALVESNPKTPAEHTLRAAEQEDATWLTRFIEETWLPEETMHGVILKEAAICIGATSKKEIDEDIEGVRKRGFPFGRAYTVVKGSTFSWIQEHTTRRYYEAVRSGAKDPEVKRMLGDLASQENFHGFIYKEDLNLEVAHNPDLVKGEIVEASSEFEMPGYTMVPQLQEEARDTTEFGFSPKTVLREIVNGLVELVGYEGLGRVALTFNSRQFTSGLNGGLVKVLLREINLPFTNQLAGRYAYSYLQKT